MVNHCLPERAFWLQPIVPIVASLTLKNIKDDVPNIVKVHLPFFRRQRVKGLQNMLDNSLAAGFNSGTEMLSKNFVLFLIARSRISGKYFKALVRVHSRQSVDGSGYQISA